jgi:hypothetical protein
MLLTSSLQFNKNTMLVNYYCYSMSLFLFFFLEDSELFFRKIQNSYPALIISLSQWTWNLLFGHHPTRHLDESPTCYGLGEKLGGDVPMEQPWAPTIKLWHVFIQQTKLLLKLRRNNWKEKLYLTNASYACTWTHVANLWWGVHGCSMGPSPTQFFS